MEQTKPTKTEEWHISFFFTTMYVFSGLWDIFLMNILETYTRKSLVNKKHDQGILICSKPDIHGVIGRLLSLEFQYPIIVCLHKGKNSNSHVQEQLVAWTQTNHLPSLDVIFYISHRE